jgi:hypothetical protein
MKYIDYFVFKIYKSYLLLNKIAPWLLTSGPKSQAALVAAIYPSLLLFSLSAYLNVWNVKTSGTWHFVTVLLLLLAYAFISFYFESRIKKIYPRYIIETKKECFGVRLL